MNGLARFPKNFFSSGSRFLAGNITELTRIRHPEVKRYEHFEKLNQDDIKYFNSILEPHRIITDENELLAYNSDWLGIARGESQIVLKPKSTEEVAKVIAHCYERNLAICPQGGNTGLVGGSVPVFDEIIISTQLMNNIEGVDVNSSVVRAQSGVILEKLDSHVADYGLMIPLDLGAKGSCAVGGNVSTNAGGLRVLRYGGLHGTVVGVEVVLAKEGGEVLDLGYSGGLKKDNTGYDLKHLFVGSEGTLGFVTKVAIACPPKPNAKHVAFIGVQSFDSVLNVYKLARQNLGEILSSCELVDEASMQVSKENLGLNSPLGQDYPFYMLVETSGSQANHDEEKLNKFLEDLMADGTILDGTVASTPSRQASEIWDLRERLAEALKKDGYNYKYDISLPLDYYYTCVEVMKERLDDKVIRCVGYGHLGDGNLHLNMTTKKYDQHVMDLIEPFLYELTSKYNGSISAEHGLGFKKRNHMHFSKQNSAINIMKQIKPIFDPKGLFNPYKVLPDF